MTSSQHRMIQTNPLMLNDLAAASLVLLMVISSIFSFGNCFVLRPSLSQHYSPSLVQNTATGGARTFISTSTTTTTTTTIPLVLRTRTTTSTATSTTTAIRFSVEDVVEQMTNSEVLSLKQELYTLARTTDRGFQANDNQRKTVKELIYDLARFNPSRQPAKDYYNDGRGEIGSGGSSTNAGGSSSSTFPSHSVQGKWQLIYTDAPDIVSLDTSQNPFSTAKLGRIGQECSPPYIKNVIEWLRPDWAKDLPFSGTDQSRVLQKVVTAASATPTKPLLVDLKVGGFELQAGETITTDDNMSTTTYVGTNGDNINNNNDNDLIQRIQKQGIPAGLLSLNPVDWKGPLSNTIPFGQFEILYLDDELRMIRTGQNYLAVNRRLAPDEEWF